jgi:hypothetical protein
MMGSRNVVRKLGFEAFSVDKISEVFRYKLSVRLTVILLGLMSDCKLTPSRCCRYIPFSKLDQWTAMAHRVGFHTGGH